MGPVCRSAGRAHLLSCLPSHLRDRRLSPGVALPPDRVRLTPVRSRTAVLALSAFTPADDPAVVTLSNESTIAFVYASACDEDTWGDDLLPVDILEPGSAAEITVSAGCWDFKAVVDNGQELEHVGIELADGETASWTVRDE